MADRDSRKGRPKEVRAPRFQIEMPIRFRQEPGANWQEGTTMNISRSGVLFLAEDLMEVNSLLELSFTLPMEFGGNAGAVVFCKGQIVRTVLPAATDARPALAARILAYHFAREEGGFDA